MKCVKNHKAAASAFANVYFAVSSKTYCSIFSPLAEPDCLNAVAILQLAEGGV